MTAPLSVLDAFSARHSTRNFSTDPLTPAIRSTVESIVSEVNSTPRLFPRSQVEIILAPTGFGLLNFIVHEQGWLFAKQPITSDPSDQFANSVETGHLLELCIIRLTQHRISTCWIAGTYKAAKAVEFCGGNCAVPGVVAFGGEAEDRWLDRTVKWFGSWRGKNEFKDKFFDLKDGTPITEDGAGERLSLCSAIASIPCGMKPHAFRVFFDEPQIHICTESGKGMLATMALFDVGNVIAHVKLHAEATGKSVEIRFLEGVLERLQPRPALYVCTAVVGEGQ
jgi:hypothetical protein